MRFNRNILFVVVAVALGVVASLAAMHYVHNAADAARSKAQTRTETVAVPVRNLNKGDILSADDMAQRAVPVDFVPANAITPADYQDYVGGVVAMPLSKGVPIPATAVQSLANHFSDAIKPGDVAVTMQVDDVNSISGLIAPGDHIDILMTLSGANQKTQSRPLLSNVLVLATGQHTGGMQDQGSQSSGAAHQYSDITMELSPLNAQRLNVAGKVGNLSVWLRRANSDTPLELGTLTQAELFGDAVRAHRSRGIQYIIGGRG